MSSQPELAVDPYCFVCGPLNQAGLRARFTTGHGTAEGRCILREEHQGYQGISHGGIVSALLDEAMVYAALSAGRWVSTAELVVRFRKAAATGAEVRVSARVVSHQKRLLSCEAELRDAHGALLATATAKLMQGREIRAGERERAAGAAPEQAGSGA